MTRVARKARLLLLAATLAVSASGVRAQDKPLTDRYEPVPEAFTRNTNQVTVNERLGESIRTDLRFVDSTGKSVELSDFFTSGRPVVLQMGYFRCPQICDIISSQFFLAAGKVDDLTIGKDYDVIYVSIDPNEHWSLAQERKRAYALGYSRPGAANGMHFLTGSQEHIAELAKQIGFSYQKVEGVNEYAHPTLLTIVTPEAKVSRYLYGVDYSQQTLRMGLVEAGQGKIGNAVDQIILLCYHYDSYSGKYTKNWMAIMRLGGGVTVLLLGSFIGLLVFRELRKRQHPRLLTA